MKIGHPEPAFREAAQEACRSIGTMVEKYVPSTPGGFVASIVGGRRCYDLAAQDGGGSAGASHGSWSCSPGFPLF